MQAKSESDHVVISKDMQLDVHELFKVVAGTHRCQVAMMTLEPGAFSGPYGTEHSHSDQFAIVVSGNAAVSVGGDIFQLSRGDAVLIVAGQAHQIRNNSTVRLRILIVYTPPAY